jgi:hypothetical protein
MGGVGYGAGSGGWTKRCWGLLVGEGVGCLCKAGEHGRYQVAKRSCARKWYDQTCPLSAYAAFVG